MAGMFSNKFDVQSTLDATLFSEAYKVGQLDSYGVGQMAAYQDGMMGSPFEAALSDKFSPEMKKQDLIDELMKKHPSPDTVEELNALANDLMANGLADMGFAVQQAARELLAANSTAAANSLRANTPPDSAFTRLNTSISNKVLTKDMVHGYMQQKWNDSTSTRYGKVGDPFYGGNMQNTSEYDAWKRQYDADYEAAYNELDGEIQNYTINYQATSPNINSLNKLLQSPEQQIQNFEIHVGQKGGNDAGNYLRDQVFVLSNAKRSRLQKVDNADDISAVSQAPVLDAMSGAMTEIPNADFNWAEDLEQFYRV